MLRRTADDAQGASITQATSRRRLYRIDIKFKLRQTDRHLNLNVSVLKRNEVMNSRR